MNLFLYIFILISFISNTDNSKPVAKNGVLDLSHWNFERDGNIELDGVWKFEWKRFVKNQDSATFNNNINSNKFWNKQGYNNMGYGSYKLDIILPQNKENLDLYLREIQCAYTLWVNGKEKIKVGKIAKNKKNEIPDYQYTSINLKSQSDTLKLVFWVSNFHHSNAGFFKTPIIGVHKNLLKERYKAFFIDIFLISSLLILGFYHLFLYFKRKEKKIFLWFFLFTILLSIRTLVVGSEILKFFIPSISWFIIYRIKYLSLFLLVYTFTLYVSELLKPIVNQRLVFVFGLVPVFLILLLFFPATIFTHLPPFIGLWIAIGASYLVYIILKNKEKKSIESIILIISIILVFVGGINDVMVAQKVYNGVYLLSFFTLTFVFAQADILSRMLNQYLDEASHLKDKLEEKNQHLETLILNREDTIKKNYKSIIDANEKLERQQELIVRQLNKIRKSRGQYRNTLNFMPQILVECTPDGKIIYANKKFYEKFDANLRILKSDFSIFSLFSEQDIVNIQTKLSIEGKIEGYKAKINIHNKIYHYLINFASLNGKDKFSGFRGVFVDITKQQKLENARMFLERALDKSGTGIVFTNNEFKVEYFNQTALKLLKIKESTLVKHIIHDFLIKNEILSDAIDFILKHEKPIRKDIELHPGYWLSVNISINKRANKAYFLFVFTNNTDYKILEQRQKKSLIQIQQKNHEITQSINYSKLIQNALINSQKDINQIFNKKSLVVNLPLDIVSGDFYFIHQHKNKIILVLGDATGHGVAGAFMSILGVTLLVNILESYPELSAADILEFLRIKILNKLSRGKELKLDVSIDMAICIIDTNSKQINYSGANRPLILIQNKQLYKYKPVKQSIGSNYLRQEFENDYIPYHKGDRIYMFSDGITDQFGGPRAKKFGSRRWMEQLNEIQSFDISTQKEKILDIFQNWKKDNKQVDDILVIGAEL